MKKFRKFANATVSENMTDEEIFIFMKSMEKHHIYRAFNKPCNVESKYHLNGNVLIREFKWEVSI